MRGELAGLFIEHKPDLALADWPDARIVNEVDRFTSALMACGGIAVQRGDSEWLERHKWFSEACERLLDDRPATRLDG